MNPNKGVKSTANVNQRGPDRTDSVNMRHVAKFAGVSVSAVSRVISGSPLVRQETREQVEAAMAELDYVVNGLVQAMQGKGSRAVRFLVHSMRGPTFADLASGVDSWQKEQSASKIILPVHLVIRESTGPAPQ